MAHRRVVGSFSAVVLVEHAKHHQELPPREVIAAIVAEAFGRNPILQEWCEHELDSENALGTAEPVRQDTSAELKKRMEEDE